MSNYSLSLGDDNMVLLFINQWTGRSGNCKNIRFRCEFEYI